MGSQITRSSNANVADDGQLDARAIVTSQGVLIQWHTTFDPTILGFNIYRSVAGTVVKINESLIAGPSLVAGARSPIYSWFDAEGTSASGYEIETIDLHGNPSRRIIAGQLHSAVVPQYKQAELLSELGTGKQVQISEMQSERAPLGNGLTNGTAANISTSSLAQQWSLAAQPALKIGIRTTGWYRVTQPQMASAGFDVSGDARKLQLFVEGSEVAIEVSRNSGVMSSLDFIEFWGQGLDLPTTDTRVYWLVNGTQDGRRIATAGEIQPSATPAQPTRPAGDPIAPSPLQFSGLSLPASSLTGTSKSNNSVVTPAAEMSASPSMILPNDEKSLASDNSIRRDPDTNSLTVKRLMSENAAPVSNPPAITIMASPLTSKSTPRRNKPKAARRRSRPQPARRHRRARRARMRHHSIAAAISQPAFAYVVEYKNRSVYYTAALNGDRENFFGPAIFGNGATISLSTRNIETSSTAPVQLEISIQGVSLGSHQVNVSVNGALAGSVAWLNQSSFNQTLTIPVSWLIDGDNSIKLTPALTTNDTSVLDYVRLSYPHSLHADNSALQFTFKSTQSARIDGFTGANIRILDVSDPNAVQEIKPIIESSGAAFAATVPAGDRGKARRLVGFDSSQVLPPSSLSLNQPSALNATTNAADLVIISHKNFIGALSPLVAQRQAQGYTVRVIDVEDIFDEFSFGEHTPQAIRDLMLLAKNSWTRAPRYLLLIGDASYDPRNYLGAGNFDFVPTKLIDTGTAGASTALETASDDWLTDFDGDGIADIPVGRLPVRTLADANLAVSKTVNFSPANTGNRALLVADTQGSYYFNFEAADDQLASILPSSMTIQKVYRRLQPSDADANTNIISSLNAGQAVTVYSGHGNVNIWGGSIFSASDAATLTNGNRLSFVVVMDCLNGYFADPSLNSMAEALIEAPNGGAVAAFASSGLTIPDGQHEMGLRMFQLLYGGSPITIGDASCQAKTATNDMDVRRTWILFGDPTLKIR
ncbi:MAG TPA: C25 family cysteine peptidase [Pyrinomonadaceae bacterium]|nr:C25 family cysteine peptidase [Pyrinomonadaceae bacterium]